jgi:hypothetical protein
MPFEFAIASDPLLEVVAQQLFLLNPFCVLRVCLRGSTPRARSFWLHLRPRRFLPHGLERQIRLPQTVRGPSPTFR